MKVLYFLLESMSEPGGVLMDNYLQLAIRYLRLNKKRSLLTIIGATIAVIVLFMILNLGWSYLLHTREKLRSDHDYEMVFLTETKEEIDTILENPKVKKASVGKYYYYDFDESKVYDNALYVNFVNPYFMERTAKQIKEQTGVKYDFNYDLSLTYMQGGDDYLGVIAISMVLLFSFIFAIFGVGIVRNSIQLSTLEQIKDYGNLRCIGASRGQLRRIIYIEGLILEGIGIVVGLMIGTIGSMIVAHFLGFHSSFHFLPASMVLLVFLGDLYFVMEENCKIVMNMTPVSAIRGEYRIKKEKFKIRHTGLIRKLFGVEGDYAYKNMLRNPGRFVKTTWSIGIGVAAFIAVAGIINTLIQIEQDYEKQFGYYHVFLDGYSLQPTQSVDDVRRVVNPELLEKMKDLPNIEKASQVYCAITYMTDWREVSSHYTDEYLTRHWNGMARQKCISKADKVFSDEESSYLVKEAFVHTLAGITCVGYDQEDIKRYDKALVDGTLDVSDHGVVLINQQKIQEEDYDEDMNGIKMIDVEFTNYKVGDTIDIIDTQKYRELYLSRFAELKEQYRDIYEVVNRTDYDSALYDVNGNVSISPQSEWSDEQWGRYEQYTEEHAKLAYDCYDELVKLGAYKTYTIEGIVKEDVNRDSAVFGEGLTFIMPLQQYYEITGTDASMSIGMQYHFSKFPTIKYITQIGNYEPMGEFNVLGEADMCNISLYPMIKYAFVQFKGGIIAIFAFVLFVVSMSCLNIINTTASNIYLRKNEFAQLRVIGFSKKNLLKAVMLEGVFSSVCANIIGVLLGVLLSYGVFRLVITILYGYIYRIPWGAMGISVVVSTLILCGSIYLPLRGLNSNLADDLKKGGE